MTFAERRGTPTSPSTARLRRAAVARAPTAPPHRPANRADARPDFGRRRRTARIDGLGVRRPASTKTDMFPLLPASRPRSWGRQRAKRWRSCEPRQFAFVGSHSAAHSRPRVSPNSLSPSGVRSVFGGWRGTSSLRATLDRGAREVVGVAAVIRHRSRGSRPGPPQQAPPRRRGACHGLHGRRQYDPDLFLFARAAARRCVSAASAGHRLGIGRLTSAACLSSLGIRLASAFAAQLWLRSFPSPSRPPPAVRQRSSR